MKARTSMKKITDNFNKVFYCGYCDLYYIYYATEPQFYNTGIYGWNCDIYAEYTARGSVAITTGYRNTRGQRIPAELIAKYTEKAQAITAESFRTPWEEKKKRLDENRAAFIAELENL